MSAKDMYRRSSANGRALFHFMFKAKYCHKIFDDEQVKNRCEKIFHEVSIKYDFEIAELGFDRNHVHALVEIGVYSRPQIAKFLKGTSAKKLLREFPYLKQKYFWDSGMWNPSYLGDAVGEDEQRVVPYIKNQGKPKPTTKIDSLQTKMSDFLSS